MGGKFDVIEGGSKTISLVRLRMLSIRLSGKINNHIILISRSVFLHFYDATQPSKTVMTYIVVMSFVGISF